MLVINKRKPKFKVEEFIHSSKQIGIFEKKYTKPMMENQYKADFTRIKCKKSVLQINIWLTKSFKGRNMCLWFDGEDSQKLTTCGLRIKMLKDCNTIVNLVSSAVSGSWKVPEDVVGQNRWSWAVWTRGRERECLLLNRFLQYWIDTRRDGLSSRSQGTLLWRGVEGKRCLQTSRADVKPFSQSSPSCYIAEKFDNRGQRDKSCGGGGVAIELPIAFQTSSIGYRRGDAAGHNKSVTAPLQSVATLVLVLRLVVVTVCVHAVLRRAASCQWRWHLEGAAIWPRLLAEHSQSCPLVSDNPLVLPRCGSWQSPISLLVVYADAYGTLDAIPLECYRLIEVLSNSSPRNNTLRYGPQTQQHESEWTASTPGQSHIVRERPGNALYIADSNPATHRRIRSPVANPSHSRGKIRKMPKAKAITILSLCIALFLIQKLAELKFATLTRSIPPCPHSSGVGWLTCSRKVAGSRPGASDAANAQLDCRTGTSSTTTPRECRAWETATRGSRPLRRAYPRRPRRVVARIQSSGPRLLCPPPTHTLRWRDKVQMLTNGSELARDVTTLANLLLPSAGPLRCGWGIPLSISRDMRNSRYYLVTC
ncbi:hypothetical protein PR048_031399 [Dryococelus australis]|uniref:Uncharacterized protein n=1 Tax=Dryococelus australis TaxID=614101 RepID=A0ABQ9G809_9NEOP|nr:hypothetical protein PR048_031399 [Dryococelus australis]